MATPVHPIEFWTSIVTGEGVPIVNDPATYEKVAGERYPIAKVVRDYQQAWLGVAPNHATPIDMLDLLLFLDAFTKEIEEEDRKRRAPIVGTEPIGCEYFDISNPGYAATCRDLARWRRRLDEYTMFTAAIPVEQESDRAAILWNVTAPLLVGWYGGETGDEIPLDPEAFPQGFDPMIRHPADIATPYTIANQLGIWIAWQDERKRRLVHEISDPLKRSASNAFYLVAAAAVLVGGYALLQRN